MSIVSRFPSYRHVLTSAAAALVRFPFAMLSATFGTVVMIMLIERQGDSSEHLLVRLAWTAALGLPLFISLAILAERLFARYTQRLMVQSLGLVALVAFYLSLPANPYSPEMYVLRCVVLFVALHALVAFVPYLGGAQVQGFWQYNKSLFLRLLVAALYSGVLFVGLAIALAAMDYLFGVDIPEERYPQLWILLAGIFNTWFFLAGVPDNLTSLNADSSYPKGLKVFTQFVLLPLVGLYFIILISYEIKIVVEWELPKGWVSQLVLWYAVVGIFSMLLLHPLREMSENKWIKTFVTWFFRTIIPLIVLLFFAIIVRIDDYGVTEPRYFVLALAVGLSAVTACFVLSKRADIRVVPIVLFIIAILSAYGPWSAFAVSERSQQGRLETILERNSLLSDGHIAPASGEISFQDRQDISSILTYLNSTHGFDAIAGYLSDSMRVSIDTLAEGSRPMEIARLIGFEYVHTWYPEREGAYFAFNTSDWGSIDIRGYDYMIRVQGVPDGGSQSAYGFGADSMFIALDTLTTTLRFSLTRDAADSARIGYLPLADTIVGLRTRPSRGWAQPAEDLSFDVSSVDFDSRFVLMNLAGDYIDERIRINALSGTLLVRKK